MNKAPTFKEFWKAYPLHKDRLRAEKAWLRMTAADKAAAIAALPAYTADCRQRGVAFQYAQGWLNGRRWEDEIEPEAPVQGSCVPLVASDQRSSARFKVLCKQSEQVRAQGDGGTKTGHSAQPNHEPLTVNHEPSDSPAPSLADMETW